MRKWLFTFVIILGILFFLPSLASFPPIKSLLIRAMERKYQAEITVGTFQLSWFGPQRLQKVFFKTKELNGFFQTIEVYSPLYAIGNNTTLIDGKIEVIGSPAALDNIQAQIHGTQIEVSGTTQGEKPGHFSVSGTALNQNQFKLSLDMTQMPSAIVDWFLNAQGRLESILGSTFDLKGNANIENQQGHFDFDLSSTNTEVSLDGSLSPTSIQLDKPLSATLQLSPQMSMVLTQNTLAVTGQDPIVLTVSANGFSFPVPFSLDQLKINRALVNLGRIRLQNSSSFSALSPFLKTKKLNANQIDIWLGEADFSLENGNLTLSRTDALIGGSLHLCLWGTVNLLHQTLDMILGIPADTLAKSFGIQNVSSSYVLQIPVTGTLQKPQFDTGSATAKIAAIIAAGQVQKQGGIFGGIAGIINQAAQEKSPPPKRPFPWEK